MTELPCPTCGSELAFFEQYNRYYCHRCQRYAPEGYGAKGARKCPNCGGVLSYVAQYDRFYCYRCNSYPPVEAEAAKVEAPKIPEPAPASEPAPTAPPTAVAPAAAAPEPVPSTPAITTPSTPAPVTAPETATQPKPTEEKPAEAAPSPSTAVVVAEAAKPQEPAEEPRPPRPNVKPAVLRLKIFTMRKSELTDLCRAYELDAAGTKEELQERLLTYLKKLEAEQEGEAPEALPPAGTPTAASEPVTVSEGPAVAASQEPVTVEPEPARATAAPVVVVHETPKAAPAAVPVVVAPTPVVVAPHVEHPCPTCGRELSFISQYGRWYCYSCQRYAPATKNACPTCGAAMRFIDQYERWWCDSCRRYAPADLPKPRTASAYATASAAQAATATVVAERTAGVHRHGSPGSGIALLAFGLMLYVAYAALTLIPDVLNYPRPALLGDADLALLNFLAFLLMALGAVVGLYSLRHRE